MSYECPDYPEAILTLGEKNEHARGARLYLY